ncbi:DUF2306 domain-containing protein [Saccharothrix obliqua]|uniref:DUF2306 domain-containing protein n=1 Tax=Saccharothrix obliqua TaxID=2861747 RepID=UPI0027E24DD5|nr:DUF2306 domain-containing protein [Saccharothrix obliqua]
MWWALVLVSAVAVSAISALPFLTLDPASSRIPLNPGVAAHYLSLVVHGLPGVLLLAIGPLQFARRLRVRYPGAHRVLGRVYLVSLAFAAVAAVFAATFSVSGLPARVAFYLLAAAWVYTAVRGYRTIRAGELGLHRVWMIRNYALSFAAVLLRVFLVTGEAFLGVFPSLDYADVYTTSAWASMFVSALAAEYFVIARLTDPLLRRKVRA